MKREIVDEQGIEDFAHEHGNPTTGESLPEPKPFHWIGGEALTQMKPRPKQMVVDKILPAGGLTLNASKSKTGKTTLMVEFCHAVSTGRPALGHYAVTTGPVLYWLADDANVDRFAESWRIVSGDVKVENFHLCVMRQHLYPDGVINLRKAAEQFRPVLIVADSYTDTAVCLIHHQSKTKQADPFDAVAGSYAMSAGAVSNGSGGGGYSGGSRPQTVELIKTFGQRCDSLVVTMDKTKADYVVMFDRGSVKGIARKRDKIATFKKDADVLFSESVRSVGAAVKDACEAIGQDQITRNK